MSNSEVKQSFINAAVVLTSRLVPLRNEPNDAFLKTLAELEHQIKATRADLTVWHYVDIEDCEDDEL